VFNFAVKLNTVQFIFLNIVRFTWFLGALAILFVDKLDFQRKINQIGNSGFDVVMRYLTHAGDGIFALLVFIALLFIRIKTAVIALICFGLTAGVVQLLKHTVFVKMKRPFYFLQSEANFRIIDDFTYHTSNSFPSGHAASIFAICTVIAYQYKSKLSVQLLLVIFAILVALTRVYLCQHFLQDIIAGSLIGTLIAYYGSIFLESKWNHLEKPLRLN
jgi:membrane-associated phospholipid phosphatase